jgi:hypothetical protein
MWEELAIDQLDDDLEEGGLGLTFAAVLVACAAILLVLLPVAVAIFQPVVPLAWAGGLVGSVGAALGGVKLVAMAWGVGARLLRTHPVTASAALAD